MVCGLKHSDFRRFSRAMCRVAMAMCSASAVISDCESVQSRYSLCNQCPRGTHSHPGQWKSELKQFLLRYPGAHVPAKPVSVAFDGDCMANSKENLD